MKKSNSGEKPFRRLTNRHSIYAKKRAAAFLFAAYGIMWYHVTIIFMEEKMAHRVICINRRHGSGAAIAARMAAEKLGISFYDEQLLDMAIKYGDLDQSKYKDIFEKVDERAPSKMFYRLYSEGNEHVEKESPASDIIYDLERQILTEKAKEEDFIVMGRCAATYLKELPDVEVVSVFATAPLDYRIEFITKNGDFDEAQAEEQIEKVDKQRRKYYEYFTKAEWDSIDNYDMIVNMGNVGVHRAAKAICGMFYNWENIPDELDDVNEIVERLY